MIFYQAHFKDAAHHDGFDRITQCRIMVLLDQRSYILPMAFVDPAQHQRHSPHRPHYWVFTHHWARVTTAEHELFQVVDTYELTKPVLN